MYVYGSCLIATVCLVLDRRSRLLLPVVPHADAVHKLEWYALRWKIETFFRTLKTSCRIEELRLATAERLANCIALCCVVAWRVS